MQNFRRTLAALACLVVGAASFMLSYVALRDVSVALEAVPPGMGWLVPIVIDGGIICGSAVIWSLSKEQGGRPKFPFFFVGTMVLISVVVNVAHAGESILAKVIAGLPPLILLGTLELVADQGRRRKEEVPAEQGSTTEISTESKPGIIAETSPGPASNLNIPAPEPQEKLQEPEATVLHLPEPRQELTSRPSRLSVAAMSSSTPNSEVSEVLKVSEVSAARRAPSSRANTSKTTETKTPRAKAAPLAASSTAKTTKPTSRTRSAAKAEESAQEESKKPAPKRATAARPIRVLAEAPEDLSE